VKIATWNLERLIKNRNEEVLEKIRAIDADILVLTETGEQNVKCII
jgi:exonuclease III